MILTASFGSAGSPPGFNLSHYRSVVAAVERAGLDAALFVRSSGSSSPMLDAVPLIAALASVPSNIGLGAGVPVDYTEPFHLARAFAAIDRLTRGRSAVVFDLAAGTDLAAAIGRSIPASDRSARILEFFEATTQLWDSWEDDAILVDRPAGLFTDANKIHRINHDGAYYAVRGPLNAPRPIQGWPVIFVPVASIEDQSIAARVADVALIRASTADIARETGAAIREQSAGHGRGNIRVLVDVVLTPGATDADASLMRVWHGAGACDGFNLILPPDPREIDRLAACVTLLGRAPSAGGITLRDRLDLPRPRSGYAA